MEAQRLALHQAFVNGAVWLEAMVETRARQGEVEVQTGLLVVARNVRQIVALCTATAPPRLPHSAAAAQPQ